MLLLRSHPCPGVEANYFTVDHRVLEQRQHEVSEVGRGSQPAREDVDLSQRIL